MSAAALREDAMVEGLVHVVDDDEAVRDSLRWLLEANGFRARVHDSAEAFLASLRMNARPQRRANRRTRHGGVRVPGPGSRTRSVPALAARGVPSLRRSVRAARSARRARSPSG